MEEKYSKKKATVLIFKVVLVLSLLLNVWTFLQWNLTEEFKAQNRIITLEQEYPLLSKRVLRELPIDILINFLPLREELKKTVEPYGDSFSLYFEYLPSGVSIGVNEKEEFEAASLFKLPIVMAYLHRKEILKVEDDVTLEIKKENIDKEFGNLWERGAGARLTDEEAIKIALTESDNTAASVLNSQITQEDLNRVYEGIDIDLVTNKDMYPLITTKHFSSILKSLYFSSVLSFKDSNKILTYLTKSKFADKLRAGVPRDVKVAHKIGVFHGSNFMDCGIVYVPRRSYILCMLSSSSEEVARERMKLVSEKVFKYVSAAQPSSL